MIYYGDHGRSVIVLKPTQSASLIAYYSCRYVGHTRLGCIYSRYRATFEPRKLYARDLRTRAVFVFSLRDVRRVSAAEDAHVERLFFASVPEWRKMVCCLLRTRGSSNLSLRTYVGIFVKASTQAFE